MRRERVEVEADFRAKGLSQLKGKWMDFAGDLLEPVVLLAAGATKAQAAWAGMRGMFEARVLGPLGLVAGASIAFLATTKLLIGRWKELGMAGAGALERMTLQFRPLLGSLDRAKERVKELQNFAVKTPFELNEIVEANKMLEVLTQGALSTEKGMTLVGDASSVAGESFSDTARQVGRLYDGLMSGRPVGEATMRLQEMGIISGATRNQIEAMQASNASGIEIWKIMEKQLERNTGAMDEQSKSLEGLQSTSADTQNQMQAGFSTGFLEGEKAGTEAAIKMMEAITPVMENLGKEIGEVDGKWAKFKLGIVEAVTGNKAFGATVEWVAKGMVGLAAVIAGASSVAIAGFTIKMLKLMAGNAAVSASTDHLTRIQSAQIPVMTKLRQIKASLAAASAANAAGLKAEAAGHLNAAAAGAKNLAATNGYVGAVGVGRKAMMGMGFAVRFVGAQLKAAAVAMLANPLVWFAAAVIGLMMAFSKLNAIQKEAKERLEGYARATSALDSGMRKQIADIRTLVDLRQAESKILTELTGAYRALDTARNSGKGDLASEAQKRVDMLKGRLKTLPGSGSLEKTDSVLSLEAGMRDGEIRKRELGRDAIAARGPEEALQVAEGRLDEVSRKRKEAIALLQEESALEAQGAERRKVSVEQEAQRQAMMERQAELQGQIADLEAKAQFNESSVAGTSVGELAVARELAAGIAEKGKALADLQAEIDAFSANPEMERINDLLASDSELQRIRAKIEVIAQMEAAVSALADAEAALGQETDEEKKKGLADNVKGAEAGVALAGKLADSAGVAGSSPGDVQALKVRRDELEARRAEDMDPVRQAELALEAEKARTAVAVARLDAEAAAEGLRLKGYEKEERLLAIEREKLNLRLRASEIGQGEYDRQEKILAARESALGRDGAERRDELSAALAISKLKRQEEEARLAGDGKAADALRKQADAIDDFMERRDAQREAESATGDPAGQKAYVERRMAERAAARDAERKREEEDRAEGRARSSVSQRGGVAAIEADLLRRRGKGKEANALKEKSAREEDELNRTEARKKFIGQGFGAKEADVMANKEVKLSQADRMMQSLTGERGTVVASTLAQIGGGGGVRGTDPQQRTLERIAKILEDLRDNSKDNVDSDGML
jgi:hypothetical protein